MRVHLVFLMIEHLIFFLPLWVTFKKIYSKSESWQIWLKSIILRIWNRKPVQNCPPVLSWYLSVLTASRFVEIAKSKKNIRLFGNKRVIHKVYKSHKMLDMDLTCSPLKFPNAVPLIWTQLLATFLTSLTPDQGFLDTGGRNLMTKNLSLAINFTEDISYRKKWDVNFYLWKNLQTRLRVSMDTPWWHFAS